MAPHLLGLAAFGGCLGVAEIFPLLRLEGFSRPAAVLASFLLGCPVGAGEDGPVLLHPLLEVRVVEACSGFDFFALVFAVFLSFALRHQGRLGGSVLWLLPVAYLVALGANACRIVCAVYARIVTEEIPLGLPDSVVHLAVGAGVFATSLAACCLAARTFYEHDTRHPRSFRA